MIWLFVISLDFLWEDFILIVFLWLPILKVRFLDDGCWFDYFWRYLGLINC
jgi:hypothetical protein